MGKRNLLLLITAILLVVNAVLIFTAVRLFQTKKQQSKIEIVEDKPTASQIIAKWNSFSNLPTIEDCLVLSFNTCFPSFSLINGEDGKPTSLAVKDPKGELDIVTSRLLIAGDPTFRDYFQAGRGDNPNLRGLVADVFMGPSTERGINPIITLEFLKASPSLDLPNFLGMEQGLVKEDQTSINIALKLSELAVTIPNSLSGYLSIYQGPKEAVSGNPAYQELGDMSQVVDALNENLLLSPVQKALVTYFALNGDINMYEKFVSSFSRFSRLRETSHQVSIVDQNAINANRSENSIEFVFCNLKPLTGMRCLLTGERNLFCSDEKLDTICNGSYTLAQ